MIVRRHHRAREGGIAMFRIIAAAGMFAVAVPLFAPGGALADQIGKATLIVTRAAGDSQSDVTGQRVRQLIMSDLARRGHIVLDGNVTPTAPDAAILRVATELRILRGAYTTQAALGLRATLVDGGTQRFLARFDPGLAINWRVAAHCPQSCIDREALQRARPLAARLAADVDRNIARFSRDRMTATARAGVSVAFRRIDRGLLPRIEQYLRNFPGVSRIRRDRATGDAVLYRLQQDGTADETDISLRKMLHHLQLKARVTQKGNSYVVEVDRTAKPAASQDW